MRGRIFFGLALTLTLLACKPDDTCRLSREVKLGVNFYLDTLNQSTGKLVIKSLSVDSVWVNGVGVDSMLYDNSKNISEIKLPLNAFANESSFRVRANSTIDTITIKHTNIDYFLSLDCGYIRAYSIDTVISTNNFIDSIAVVQQSVNTTYIENIQIHHRK